MIVNFEKSFAKDIKKLNDISVSKKLKQVLYQLETSRDLQNILNIKRLKTHSDYFRIKLGKYRLGFSYKDNTIDIIRFLHRKDIYKLFP